MLTNDDLYSPFELRLRTLAKADFGSDEHRKLVLALTECLELVLPLWTGEPVMPTCCARTARKFAAGEKLHWGRYKITRSRAWQVQRGISYDTDRLSYQLIGAAVEVLNTVANPENAAHAMVLLTSVYVDAKFGVQPVTGNRAEDGFAWFRRSRVLAREYEAQVTAILDRIFVA